MLFSVFFLSLTAFSMFLGSLASHAQPPPPTPVAYCYNYYRGVYPPLFPGDKYIIAYYNNTVLLCVLPGDYLAVLQVSTTVTETILQQTVLTFTQTYAYTTFMTETREIRTGLRVEETGLLMSLAASTVAAAFLSYIFLRRKR